MKLRFPIAILSFYEKHGACVELYDYATKLNPALDALDVVVLVDALVKEETDHA